MFIYAPRRDGTTEIACGVEAGHARPPGSRPYAWPLRRRLLLLFIILFSTFLLQGAVSVWCLINANEVSTDVRERWLPNIRLLGDLNNFTSDYRTAEANSLLASNADGIAAQLREIQSLDHQVTKAQKAYEAIHHNDQEQASYSHFSDTWSAYKLIAGQVTALAASGHNAEAVQLYRTGSRIVYDRASDMLGELTDYNVMRAAQASERSALAFQRARWLMGGALAAVGLMLVIVILQVERRVSSPLQDLGRAMHRLADNDTSIEVEHTRLMDEVGDMARAVVVFRGNAVELIQSRSGLEQQATMLQEKLAHEQAVTQMRQNFVSMITHEFRTPLTQIDAQAQRLISLRDRLDSQDVCDRAGRIRAAVERIIRLIDNLVHTSQIMDGGSGLFFHPEQIDIRTVLNEACRMHREISPNARILEALGAEPLTMQADAKLLFQTFSNLLSNAVKYAPSAALISVQASRNQDIISVVVEDNGIGIPEDERTDIFKCHFRGRNTTGYVGAGVGLFLVATVIHLHGGEIAVEGDETGGSRFIITLPATSGRPETVFDG